MITALMYIWMWEKPSIRSGIVEYFQNLKNFLRVVYICCLELICKIGVSILELKMIDPIYIKLET